MNIDTFIIRVGFGLANVDTIRTLTHRGGKIDPTRWPNPVRPKLGAGWAIKLLARKKRDQIWPGPVWPSLVWADPTRQNFFLPLKYYLARLARFLGRAELLKFWSEKTGSILA